MNILSSDKIDKIDEYEINHDNETAYIDYETLQDKIGDLKGYVDIIIDWTKNNIIKNLDKEELKIHFDQDINIDSESELKNKLKCFIKQIV